MFYESLNSGAEPNYSSYRIWTMHIRSTAYSRKFVLNLNSKWLIDYRPVIWPGDAEIVSLARHRESQANVQQSDLTTAVHRHVHSADAQLKVMMCHNGHVSTWHRAIQGNSEAPQTADWPSIDGQWGSPKRNRLNATPWLTVILACYMHVKSRRL